VWEGDGLAQVRSRVLSLARGGGKDKQDEKTRCGGRERTKEAEEEE